MRNFLPDTMTQTDLEIWSIYSFQLRLSVKERPKRQKEALSDSGPFFILTSGRFGLRCLLLDKSFVLEELKVTSHESPHSVKYRS